MEKRIRIFFYLIALAFFAVPALASAAEESAADVGEARDAPLRIAQMTTMATSFYTPPAKVMDRLDARVDDALHIPLNNVLHAVEYLPDAEVAAAFDEARAGMAKAKYKDIVRAIAQSLHADLVVLPVVTRYDQHERMSWRWDRGMIRTSYAAVELHVYDRARDRVVDKGASRFYSDEMSVRGEVSVMVEECMDQVLREADLKKLVTDAALPKTEERGKGGGSEKEQS